MSNLIKNFTYFEHFILLAPFMSYYNQNSFFIKTISKFPNQLMLAPNVIFNFHSFYYTYNQKNAYPYV